MSSHFPPADFRENRWTIPVSARKPGEPAARRRLQCLKCNGLVDVARFGQGSAEELVDEAKAHVCMPPAYFWDEWEREALAARMDPDLAALGRALLRENVQHGWGLNMDEEAMLSRGLKSPQAARRRWSKLLNQEEEGIS